MNGMRITASVNASSHHAPPQGGCVPRKRCPGVGPVLNSHQAKKSTRAH